MTNDQCQMSNEGVACGDINYATVVVLIPLWEKMEELIVQQVAA